MPPTNLFPTATNYAPTNHFGSKIIPILPLLSPIKEIDFGPADVLVCSGWQSERPQHSVKTTENMFCIQLVNFVFKVNGNMEF